jgi:hypothetical protein
MSWRDRTWKYNDAATTAKPGYLKERFKQIREQQEKHASTSNVVRPHVGVTGKAGQVLVHDIGTWQLPRVGRVKK